MVVGELPKDQKRLSLKEAKEIINNNKDVKEILKAFDKVAGAPDWEGGSAIISKIYYLNDEHTEAIRCQDDFAFDYVIKGNDNDSWEEIHLNY